jgi:RNA polymerase sigma-B factor
VRRHLPLARTLAARYSRTQEPFDDVFQVASLGLIKAAQRFDPDRGNAFSSYAVPTILGEIKRHFRDKGRPIHLPRGLQELVMRVHQAEEQLSSRTGRSPTVQEIAEYLSLSSEAVLEALEAIAARNATSLDAPIEAEVGDDAATPHDVIGREEEGYALVDASASLAVAARRLRKTDREVLALRFRDGLTQTDIARQIGVSQMQVSRILRRATDQLRETIDGEDSDAS